MMYKHIRMMIDEIFSDMKMTAENLALRDELLANAQARFEDAVAMGKREDEAFIEVAASLGDVQALLDEMNRMPQAEPAVLHMPEENKAGEGAETEKPEAEEPEEENAAQDTDLGDALNRAFAALGGWGHQVMPRAKKLVRRMDDATGGMIKDIGKAAQKGFKGAQKAAGKTISKLSGDKGELVFDFGQKKRHEADVQDEKPEDLRKEAADLRAQAGIKEVTGSAEEAKQMRMQADELETQADAMEQMQEMEAACRTAQQDAQASGDSAQDEPVLETEKEAEPAIDHCGQSDEIDEGAFSRTVDEIAREAEQAIRQAAECVKDTVNDAVNEAEYIVRDAKEPVSGCRSFPSAGLHKIDIQLDADDVCIEPGTDHAVQIQWEVLNDGGEPVFEMQGHTLVIRRKNPDVFKTFFSVFKKDGGKITVCVPMGYGASYAVSTTSGDVLIRGMDADDIRVTTTSGCVRVEMPAGERAQRIAVTTVSGHATVSACADDVAVTTVSGDQFITCDAHKVDVNVVSGKVHVEGACDEWEIDAVSSDVELLCTAAPTKKVQIASMHGTVRLALPQDIGGFTAETNSALGCLIVNEFGSNHYGTCELPIRMDTMRGSLMITRL